MGIPHTLNSHPVRAIAYRGAGSYYVLIQRIGRGFHHPWVAATWVGGSSWVWGRYHHTEEAAKASIPDAVWTAR